MLEIFPHKFGSYLNTTCRIQYNNSSIRNLQGRYHLTHKIIEAKSIQHIDLAVFPVNKLLVQAERDYPLINQISLVPPSVMTFYTTTSLYHSSFILHSLN